MWCTKMWFIIKSVKEKRKQTGNRREKQVKER
jgi:hypothetical protein